MRHHLPEKARDNLAAANGCIDLLRCCAPTQDKAQIDMSKVLPLYEDLSSLAARAPVERRQSSSRSHPQPPRSDLSRGGRNVNPRQQQQGDRLNDSNRESDDKYRDLVRRAHDLCTN